MAEEIATAVPNETSDMGALEKSSTHHHEEIEDDPHVTAFDEDTGKLTPATWAAVFFLGLTFQAAIGFSFSCVVAILVPIALDLEGSTLNISWIPSGWAVASSVSFAIAGQFSDIFGRRYVMLFGQLCVVIGHVQSLRCPQLTEDCRRFRKQSRNRNRCRDGRRIRNRHYICRCI